MLVIVVRIAAAYIFVHVHRQIKPYSVLLGAYGAGLELVFGFALFFLAGCMHTSCGVLRAIGYFLYEVFVMPTRGVTL